MTLYAEYRHLGRMDYSEALELQRNEFRRLSEGNTPEGCAGTIFTVEHPDVYTIGKHGDENNLLVDEEVLRNMGARLFRTDRGGDITFHGEGQIVGYPVLNLALVNMGLRQYIFTLEQAVIDTLARYGTESGRSEGASGVWTGGNVAGKGPLRKVCAIGVRASRYITMHGFALNVTTDLHRFEVINPCGFTDRGVTSMQRELGYAPDIDEVRVKVVTRLAQLLGAECRMMTK